ncbi:MAG: hypothetical protein KDA66_08955 [Planctomycetaceae bacterium]|nr:hypothetical protein [Planctomycetaceae bacterium]
MNKALKGLLLALALVVGTLSTTSPVMACPMCRVANEDTEDPAAEARPRAYMYSILFMLAMPASIATFFGVSLYRLSRQRDAMNEEVLGDNNI